MNTDDQTRAWDLMKAIDYCMLVTHAGGSMHARPMSSIVKPDEGKIYFLSDARAAKDEEITANPDILLAYSDGKTKFVSALASATVINDRALVERLWNPGAQAFWPNGPSALTSLPSSPSQLTPNTGTARTRQSARSNSPSPF